MDHAKRSRSAGKGEGIASTWGNHVNEKHTRADAQRKRCDRDCSPCEGCCDCRAESSQRQRRARRWAWVLTGATIGWNTLEATVATVSGILAHSIALVGYGLDAVVEVSSALVVVWRMAHRTDGAADEALERRATRLVGVSLWAIAAYVAVEAVRDILAQSAPDRSAAGLAIVALSLVVMPALAHVKRGVAANLDSSVLRADAAQTQVCFYLAVAVLIGLIANDFFGVWWMDPLAGLLVAGIAAREGHEAWSSAQVSGADHGFDAHAICVAHCCPACPGLV
ncbi:MAG TPA: cation transporter [Chloroflexota bacterium]|nr:cation transporter [Chloroflexota bacterium]